MKEYADGAGEGVADKHGRGIMTKRKYWLGATILCTILPAMPVTAQTLDSAAPDQGAVGEIVVTAQRREQRLSEVPISIQAQTGETLSNAGITSSSALVQVSPAVSFTTGFSSSSTSFSIRGAQSYDAEGGVQPSVGVIIDDMPVARQAEVVLDLADIERIEILSGPQGTLFGKNATAGVINIVTARPKNALESSFDISATNDREIFGRAMVNAPVSDRVAIRVNGYYRYLDPLLKNFAGPDYYGQRSYGGQAKLLLDVSDSVNVLFGASYAQSSNSFGVLMVVVPSKGALGQLQSAAVGPQFIGRGVDIVNQNNPTLGERSRTQAYTAQINADLTDDLKLTSITGMRKFDLLLRGNDNDAGPMGVNPGVGFSPNPLSYPVESLNRRNPARGRYSYWSQELRLAYSGSVIDAVGGVFYQNFDERRYQQYAGFVLDGSLVGRTPGEKFFSDNVVNTRLSNDTLAFFVDATYSVTPTIKLFGGARYSKEELSLDYDRLNYFNPIVDFFDPVTLVNTASPIGGLSFTNAKDSINNVSGRAGLQWQPTPMLNYYVSYNRGYKGPAAIEGSGLPSKAAALLKPEIGQAIEIGAKQRFFDGALSINLAAYHQKIEGIQQASTLPGSVTRLLLNAGSLKTDGFEASVTGRPTRDLTLNASVVYNHARYGGPFGFPCGPSATRGVGACRADGTIALAGTRAIGVPTWKFVASLDYGHDLNEQLRLTTHVGLNWQSSVQYTLQHEPLTVEPKRAIINASVGLGAVDKRWEVSAFVNNITNHFYYGYLNTVNGFVGQSYGFLPRDYKRYGGLRLRFKFD
jgi:iron complex outermembrane receptor protein